MKVPTYMTNEPVTFGLTWRDEKKLPSGTFVKPISLKYVPQHVKEKWTNYDSKTQEFCYTSAGIIPIPRKAIIQV
jgi:hypothetical protein